MKFLWQPVILSLAIMFTGCEISTPQAEKANQANIDAKKRAQRAREVAVSRAKQQKELEQAARVELPPVERAYLETQSSIRSGSSGRSSSGSSSASLGSYRGDSGGVRMILKQLDDAVEVDPTLVVWLIDTSASATRVTNELRTEALSYYAGDKLKSRLAENATQLTTAVVGFADGVNFALETPSADPAEVKSAFDKLTSNSEGKENTFAALKEAVEKYAPLRASQRRQLVFVLATDEAGDDPQVADQVVPLLRKHEIPVYVVGLNAPWGLATPGAAKDDKKKTPSNSVFGPETVASERVFIQFSTRGFSSSPVGEMVDSGFGPHGLERVARAGGGAFFAVRAAGGGTWPPGNELRFDPQIMKKYAPDYLSADEYKKLLAENKCRLALHEAAKLPPAEALTSPTTSFAKQNEARLKTALTAAQRLAAHVGPELDKLHDTLAIGEGDRGKLTGARWQVGFDLAYGRALAAKVRADGYNAMLAALQRGKNFENASSNTWNLEMADTIDAGSAYQKMIDKAREYLTRVTTEHPGTPWAKEAEEELKTPMGWKLRES